jgi:hypothetical protein
MLMTSSNPVVLITGALIGTPRDRRRLPRKVPISSSLAAAA